MRDDCITVLLGLSGLRVRDEKEREHWIRMQVEYRAGAAQCPWCGAMTGKVHSRRRLSASRVNSLRIRLKRIESRSGPCWVPIARISMPPTRVASPGRMGTTRSMGGGVLKLPCRGEVRNHRPCRCSTSCVPRMTGAPEAWATLSTCQQWSGGAMRHHNVSGIVPLSPRGLTGRMRSRYRSSGSMTTLCPFPSTTNPL